MIRKGQVLGTSGITDVVRRGCSVHFLASSKRGVGQLSQDPGPLTADAALPDKPPAMPLPTDRESDRRRGNTSPMPRLPRRERMRISARDQRAGNKSPVQVAIRSGDWGRTQSRCWSCSRGNSPSCKRGGNRDHRRTAGTEPGFARELQRHSPRSGSSCVSWHNHTVCCFGPVLRNEPLSLLNTELRLYLLRFPCSPQSMVLSSNADFLSLWRSAVLRQIRPPSPLVRTT